MEIAYSRSVSRPDWPPSWGDRWLLPGGSDRVGSPVRIDRLVPGLDRFLAVLAFPFGALEALRNLAAPRLLAFGQRMPLVAVHMSSSLSIGRSAALLAGRGPPSGSAPEPAIGSES